MEPRRKDPEPAQRRASILLVSLLLISLVPAFTTPVMADDSGRDANINVSISPSAQTVNPGETAEYTVRVYNQGSNPVSVNLAANNAQDCTGYSAAIGQIGQPIEAGDYGETFLNVTLAQNAEGSCVTTVTATGNEQVTPPDQPGQPAQATQDVETTAGDGAGSALFGVDLTVENPSRTWGGQSTIEWDVEVENTGRVQETIDLSIDTVGGSGCTSDGSMSISVEPSQVQIDNESSEWVLVTLQVPDGKQSDKFCWEITGVVTNDQNPNGSASDTEEFDLFVPELKECTLELSKTSMNIDPDDTGTLTATFSNDGNTDWSVNVGFQGSHAGWASVDGASSGMLPYNNGNGEKEFTIEITPDDSINANSQKKITIQGKDGNTAKCFAEVTVTVGQSPGASMSLGNSQLYNVQPGTSAVTTLTVTNQGNGQDTFRITTDAPPSGWSVELESSTVSTESRHSSSGKSATIDVTITLPDDALASEDVMLTFSVVPTSGGGDTYASQDLRVTVQAIHGMSGGAPADDQTGRSDTTVSFPINVQNDGNTLDRFRFSVISQTSQPGWGKHFETADGTVVTEVDIEARQSIIMYLVVSIDGEEELDSTRLTVRVTNLGDNNNGDENNDGVPDNQLEFVFRAILSNRDFAMDAVIMNSEFDLTRSENLVLPPGGVATYQLKVMNTGDLSDEAIFDISGLTGIATRTLYFQGLEIDGPISVPKGWGAYNSTSGFHYMGNSPMIASSEDKIFEKMVEEGIHYSHEPIIYYAIVTVEIEVSSGAENGDGGILEIVVTSVSNAANRSGKVSFSLSVETVHSVEIDRDIEIEKNITFGQLQQTLFEINVTNSGNTDSEIKIQTSPGLRGWNLFLSYSAGADCVNNGDHLICNLEEGEVVKVIVKVTPPGGDSATVADSFTFTLFAEPTEIELAGRENIELTVNGEPESFGFGTLLSPNVVFGIAGAVLIGFLILALRKRI